MAKFKRHAQVNVTLPEHQYPILIGSDGFTHELLNGFVHSNQVLIVTNETVAPLYLKSLQSVFDSIQCDTIILPDGEQFKDYKSLGLIYDALIINHHHKDTTLIALGGGVIGDITGFAAATYQRGVRWLQIPTTLLAQVDASVGGKTAINHPFGKNLIGSFYQPHGVVIDLNTLSTLPPREFQSGLAEIIKYGLIAGGDFFTQLQHDLKLRITYKSPQLPNLIKRCCEIKASFVMHDEKETGTRALLNLGHTFAHALEAYSHYERWLHGEAVAIGLYCAAVLSKKMGLMDAVFVEQIEQMIHFAELPHKIPNDINLDDIRQLMGLDKKIKHGSLRFVVMNQPGACYLNENVTEACLQETLKECQADFLKTIKPVSILGE